MVNPIIIKIIKIIKIKTRVIIIISRNLNKMDKKMVKKMDIKMVIIIIKAFKRLNKTNQIKPISNLNKNPTLDKDKTNSTETNQVKIKILTKNSITITKATAEMEKVILITKEIESSDYQIKNVK
jgi:hypothetical protein